MNEENKNEYVDKTLDDHESRLRKLEESDIKQQIQLAEIQKSQSDLKVLVMTANKEQSQMLKESNDKMLNAILGNNDTKNKIKLQDRKEVWAIAAATVTALITWISKLLS